MIDPLNYAPFYRDTWGSFDPIAHAQLAPLASDQCYLPKDYKAPDDDAEIIPAGKYLKFGLEITPGSVIWGIKHKPASGSFNAPGFSFKVTDMSLGIEIWDIPASDLFVSNATPGFFPSLLNAPYPVVGTGLFNVEFWNPTANPLRCNLVFGVCEVVTNPCQA